MSKVIVTGASGYLGRHVVRALSRRGVSVIAIARGDLGADLAGVQQLNRDLWSLTPEEWVEYAQDATLIHLAWRDGFRHESIAHMGELSKHFSLVNTLAELGLKRFVSIGSMHEIGPTEGLITEEIACNPVSQYGIAKNAFQSAAAELCARTGISFAWLRCFYIIGDDERNHSVFTRILEQSLAGDSDFPLTTGTAQFDFIDVAELGELICSVSLSSTCGIVNLGSGNVQSLRSAIEQFISNNRLQIKPKFGAFPERSGISAGAWPDLSKLHDLQRNDFS